MKTAKVTTRTWDPEARAWVDPEEWTMRVPENDEERKQLCHFTKITYGNKVIYEEENKMTTQERIAMMDRKIAEEKAQAELNRVTTENKQQMLKNKILGMSDRIKALIELGNDCAMKGMMPSIDFYHDHRVADCFCTDGIHHEVGFRHIGSWWGNDNKYSIRYVGFENGGANGVYDFYTDGETVFEEHEDANSKNYYMNHGNTPKRREPTIEHMQKFLENFDAFEKMFYAWFDKRFGEG